jgi:hypothetical protein
MMFRKRSHFVPLFDKAIMDNRIMIDKIKQKYLGYDPTSKCAAVNRGPVALSK